MNTIKIMALALGVAFSSGAFAQKMSNTDYKAEKVQIGVNYKAAKATCGPLSGNASDICIAEAKGKEKVAKAELEAAYQPSAKTHYKARIAKTEAEYALAKEKCDDLAGNAKDVCRKEAKAAKNVGKAEAKAELKTTDANAEAMGKSAEARSEARAQTAEAQKDVATEKLDAKYSVAKEKCDMYAGGAKEHCLDQAKANFGKK